MPSDKKRKRDSAAALPGTQIDISTAETSAFPPIVVATRGIAIPPTLSFKPYTKVTESQDSSTKKSKRTKSEYLLHGSTARVDYEGREDKEDMEYTRHYIGIYDPEKNSVELYLAPKLQIGSTIKEHRARDLEIEKRGFNLAYQDARVALGKEFGTKKAQKALESREMNRIDVTDMDHSVKSSIITQVGDNTKDMPTQKELETATLDQRPIPKYTKDATRKEDVYKREDIISNEEWESIYIGDWLKSGQVLSNSTYVKNRAGKLLEDSAKQNIKPLKMLKYISWLIDFYVFQSRSRGRLPQLPKTLRIMRGASQVVGENLYKRYTEAVVTEKEAKHSVSPTLANKILFYMAVLCLMVDEYEVDIFDLKTDLAIQTKEISQAFKEVGCKVTELTATQVNNLKLTKAEAAQHRRAILTAPPTFPNAPRRRAPTGRR